MNRQPMEGSTIKGDRKEGRKASSICGQIRTEGFAQCGRPHLN